MTPLSPRQREVTGLLLTGMSEREIAEAMGLRPGTIKVHIGEVYQRLCVSSRAELMAQLMQPTEEARSIVNHSPPAHPAASRASAECIARRTSLVRE